MFKIYLPFVGLCRLLFQFSISLAARTLVMFSLTVCALLVMAIPGGAVLPPVQGFIADATRSLQFSFIVPLVACICVACCGIHRCRAGRKPETISR